MNIKKSISLEQKVSMSILIGMKSMKKGWSNSMNFLLQKQTNLRFYEKKG